MTQGAAVANGSADVYARNVCSSVSFSPSIMSPEERRARIQDKLQQQINRANIGTCGCVGVWWQECMYVCMGGCLCCKVVAVR